MAKKQTPKNKTDADNEEGWSTGAKVGAAAVGSAALMAALLYAGKKYKDRNAPPKKPKKVRDDD